MPFKVRVRVYHYQITRGGLIITSRIIIPTALRLRRDELSELSKFRKISSIRTIIGKYGLFIKKPVAEETLDENFELYKISDDLPSQDDLKAILAAAIPIDLFLQRNGTDFDATALISAIEIINTCLKLKIPLFLISQKDCLVYHVSRDNQTLKIIYDCPDKRAGSDFKCKAKNSQFCALIKSENNQSAINRLLTSFYNATGDVNIPLFEFSTFINHCIFSHYSKIWTTRSKSEKAEEAENDQARLFVKPFISNSPKLKDISPEQAKWMVEWLRSNNLV